MKDVMDKVTSFLGGLTAILLSFVSLSILAEVMLGKIYFSNVGSRKVRKDKVYQASADRLVRVCPICKLAWEGIKMSSMSKNKNILYYKNMPKYGKKTQICTRCSEEEE